MVGIVIVYYGSTGFWRASLTVEGMEFSPATFNSRTFTYIINFRTVTGSASMACSTEISKYLTRPLSQLPTSRWDVVHYSSGVWGPRVSGEASILVDAITDNGFASDGNFWATWSKSHPAFAAILWPAIQDAALNKNYFVVPKLLQIAHDAKSPTSMKSDLNAALVEAAIDQVESSLKNGDTLLAKQNVKWGKAIVQDERFIELEKRIAVVENSPKSPTK